MGRGGQPVPEHLERQDEQVSHAREQAGDELPQAVEAEAHADGVGSDSLSHTAACAAQEPPRCCVSEGHGLLSRNFSFFYLRTSFLLRSERLVIRLQAKHDNKWKKIATEVPGRTAKRLGKWWEVFKKKRRRSGTTGGCRAHPDEREGTVAA
ncbi:hypothetical protein ZWY2020_018624 [Hordeum vulgare]|nr:hypothetical protein ZWY2020_018624 [Hordeum vulgare]